MHSLGKKVVAEGIENAATWALLLEAGCDIAQGYYLARPMPFAELLAWLDDGSVPKGDVGLEVDYFLEEGNWISDVIQVDDLGMGFIDVDGMIPDSTWATGRVMDAAGNVIPGFHNLSFPISLHGLNKDSYSGIRVQVNMGTDDPFLTPILNSVHVGSVRTMNALGPGNGWDVSPSLGQSNGNLTNSGSAVLQINGDF
ncbi:MAG: EAL domain-containing protein, partial [Gemmataceae bacterium]